MALLSDGGIIRRYVLLGDHLQPGNIPISAREIAGRKIFVEIRNGAHQLPVENKDTFSTLWLSHC